MLTKKTIKTILLMTIFIGMAPSVSRAMESEQKRTKLDSLGLTDQFNETSTVPTLKALAAQKIISEISFTYPEYYRASLSRLPVELRHYLSDTARQNLPSRELLRLPMNKLSGNQYSIDRQGTRLCINSSKSNDSLINIFDIPTSQLLSQMSFQELLLTAARKNPSALIGQWGHLLDAINAHTCSDCSDEHKISALQDLMKIIFIHTNPKDRKSSFTPGGKHLKLSLKFDPQEVADGQIPTPNIPQYHTIDLAQWGEYITPLTATFNAEDATNNYPKPIKRPEISNDYYEEASKKNMLNPEESISVKRDDNKNFHFYKICSDKEEDELLTTAQLGLNNGEKYKLGLFSPYGTFFTLKTVAPKVANIMHNGYWCFAGVKEPGVVVVEELDIPLCDMLDELAKEPIG